MGKQRRMLAACECSGRVRDAFAALGWDAWSCDLLPSQSPDHDHPSGGRARHIQGDALAVQLLGPPGPYEAAWDLVVSFPECTHLSLAGAVWWKQKQADGRQQQAADFFMAMTRWDAPRWAVENPLGAMDRLYRKHDQQVQPWWFGDPWTKRTCLWLHGLPPLVADRPVDPVGRIATGGGSWRTDKAARRIAMSAYEDSEGRANRAKVRSRTLPGFARAMAAQWSAFIEQEEEEAA